MDTETYYYHLATLREQDPDYIVDVLELTSDDLLTAFGERAERYIEEEYG
jgi:hypothetical protein